MIPSSHFHPMLVHFPIALVTFGFIAEIISIFFKKEKCLSTIGFYLLIFGTLTAVTALLTGVFFTSEMSGIADEVKETHELFASLTLIALFVTSVLRIFLKITKKEESSLKWIVFLLYALAAIFVSATGFYGGKLVYSYMMPL